MKSVTLTQFLTEERRAGYGNTDLIQLLEVVARACKRIGVATGKGALGGVLGEAGSENIQGEAQKKLDVLSNEILLDANAWGGHLAACASEEMEDPQPIPDAYPKGGYLLLFDPLDGSSNIDVNISVGTIFSVLKRPEDAGSEAATAEFLQPGRDQVAAGYVVYGPSTLLVLTIGHGTHVFTLDREVGSFILTRRDARIPEKTSRIRRQHVQPATTGKRRCSATSTTCWPAARVRAGATSTCAGWPRWWPTCTASSPAAASSATRWTRKTATRAASCD